MLPVLFAKRDSCAKRTFREQTRAVEVIQSVFAVIPSTYISVVLKGMTDHTVELVARVAVLCCRIADSDAFGRLGHRAYVERETVGVSLTESPHLVGYGFYTVAFSRIVMG